VRLLLEKGAKIESRSSHGYTALHSAAGNGQKATVRLPVFLSGQASPALHRPGRAALSGGF